MYLKKNYCRAAEEGQVEKNERTKDGVYFHRYSCKV